MHYFKFHMITGISSRAKLPVSRMYTGTHMDHTSFTGHVRWTVANTEFGLQRVEVSLQTTLLLSLRWLLIGAVAAEFTKTVL